MNKITEKWLLTGIVIGSVRDCFLYFSEAFYLLYPIKARGKIRTKKEDSASSLQKKTDITTGMWGSCLWTFDSSTGELSIGGGNLGIASQSPWNTKQILNTTIQAINFTGNVKLPVTSSQLFSGTNNELFLSLLTSVTNSSLLDTSQVRDMTSMFYGCKNLNRLDISSWETAQVTKMTYTFYSCINLSTLDVSSWNTNNVTDMNGMFVFARGLKSLDISSFTFAQVEVMDKFLYGTTSLSKLTVGASFATLRGDNSVIGLPNPKQFKGGWIGISESNKDVVYGSSDDLVDDFRSENQGIFVWEKVAPNLTSKFDRVAFVWSESNKPSYFLFKNMKLISFVRKFVDDYHLFSDENK